MKKQRGGLLVRVKTYRKAKQTKSEGRNNKPGKLAIVFRVDENGSETQVCAAKGTTFRAMYSKLVREANKYKVGLPIGVNIKHYGETFISFAY